MKRIRVSLTALLVGAFMFLSPSSVFAESVMTTITCATPDGQQQEFQVGWDNSNEFFNGRGEIPRLYCEGGYAGAYTVYVSDALAIDDPLRWYNGVAPEPVESVEPELEPTPEIVEPSPEPIISVEPEPVPSVQPSLPETPTPSPEPSQDPTPDASPTDTLITTPPPTLEPIQAPEPTPEPSESTQATVTPTPEPKPTPTPKVSQVAPVPLVEPSPTASDLAPDLVPAEVVQESVQIVALEVPTALANIVGITQIFAAAEAFMNIGSDMTDEEREESQSVVVAAVIVGQLAMRKTK